MKSSLAYAYANDEDEQGAHSVNPWVDPLQPEAADTSWHQAPPRGPATFAIVYPLNRLGDQELQKPIVVSVEWDDAEIVMSNAKLRIWGTGADIYEALGDFTGTFKSLIASYGSTPPEELTEGAVSYLAELRSYLP